MSDDLRNVTRERISRRAFMSLMGTVAMAGAAFALPGCGRGNGENPNVPADNGTAPANSTEPEPVETIDRTQPRTIVDDGGRSVTIPALDTLERIYPTSSLAQIFLITMAPDLMAGSTTDYTDDELMFLPSCLRGLPNLGTLSGKGELNFESILAADVQLIFSIGNAGSISEKDIDQANTIQDQTGIPVVLIDAAMDNIGHCYTVLGDILGMSQRAKQLADYCDGVLKKIDAAVGGLKEDEKVRLYYAEGSTGLQTEPSGSTHAAAFVRAGAHIVAEVPEGSKMGMNEVSLENVIAWDPDVIIAWNQDIRGGAENIIRTDPDWASIKAVKDGRVYTMPNQPFAWCDRPGAVNRILGVQWI
ncbi:MAG: ABC transporter substrate-binding protein, partial [Coriobacteriales bacterium]|nr:ABC transporter substrate-binding protein [Coriobacteriales bacterium]